MMIEGKAIVDNKVINCYGEIIIHWLKKPQAFITWELFNEETLIASKSENYFIENDNINKDELLSRVIKKIEKYKMKRKKVFEEIKIRGEK
jgi:hypothetical protein